MQLRTQIIRKEITLERCAKICVGGFEMQLCRAKNHDLVTKIIYLNLASNEHTHIYNSDPRNLFEKQSNLSLDDKNNMPSTLACN